MKKEGKFNWTTECKEALQLVKEYFKNLSCLSISRLEELLYLYLVALKKTISAVFVQEREREQKPVYFVNQALHDAEVHYQPIEKATLVLITVARKLKTYFQWHIIKILTDLSLG